MTLANDKIWLLDGGLGTTLEDVFGKDISSPLWSASLVEGEPETIINAHTSFLDAGADMLLTSTYQCALNTFHRAGYADEDAVRLMHKSVRLAAEARSRFLGKQVQKRDIKIVLSLGPYGATLFPAQEFDGYYPPPYGPRAYNPDGGNTTEFTKLVNENAARDALKEFHLQRLLSFREQENIWALIDMIAFETVTLEREAWAVRMSVKKLIERIGEPAMKPWYISTVWNHGSSAIPHNGKDFRQNTAFVAMVSALTDHVYDLPLPSGLGVNCTQIADLDAIVAGFRLLRGASLQKPLLVMYPNGGDTYDISTRTWTGTANDVVSWATQLANIARRERMSGSWAAVVVGGCCKTGPMHIRALQHATSASDAQ